MDQSRPDRSVGQLARARAEDNKKTIEKKKKKKREKKKEYLRVGTRAYFFPRRWRFN